MGRELFEQHAVFRRWMLRLDGVARELLGGSVVERVYDPSRKKGDTFDATRWTHPAIFMVEYAMARTLLESGVTPDHVLGTSLGELVAAAVADVWTPEDALVAVIRQAQVLESSCPPGGMIAVLADARLYEEEQALHRNSELASVNFDSHFVVAGGREPLKAVEEALQRRKVGYQALNVSRGFHSSWIDGAREPYVAFHRQLTLRPPQTPFASALVGGPVTELQIDHFWQVVRRPIEFKKALRALDPGPPAVFVDVGPSGTLATFVKNNLPSLSAHHRTLSIMTPFGIEMKNLGRALDLFRSLGA
jgi:bacillaene synthase trans-acting acyltransferase